VEIGGEVLALGVSEGQITLLTKVENQEFVAKMTAYGPGRPEAFSLLQCLQGMSLRSKKPGLLRRVNER
jgi:hypothetical protein